MTVETPATQAHPPAEIAILDATLQMVHDAAQLDKSDDMTCLQSFDERLHLLHKYHEAYLSAWNGQKKLRNSLAPTAKLPVELLLRIFIDVAEDGASFPAKYYRQLFSVAGTCHHWYNLSVSTPMLWNRVGQDLPGRLLRLILERNARGHFAKLHVDLGRSTRKTSTDDFIKIILPLHDRWTSLSVGYYLPTDQVPLLRELWTTGGPRLESLDIQGPGWAGRLNLTKNPSIPATNLFKATPILRNLRLSLVSPIRATCNIFSGLASLHLMHLIIVGDNAQPNPFLSILEKCPELEVLHVQNVRVQPPSYPRGESSAMIQLPQLKSLSMYEDEDGEPKGVMNGISAPFCEKVHGDIEPGEGLARSCGWIRASQGDPFTINLTFHNSFTRLEAQRGAYKVDVSFPKAQNTQPNPWQWLAEFLGNDLDERISISAMCIGVDWKQDAGGRSRCAWLMELHNTRELQLEGCQNVQHLFHALSTRMDVVSSTSTQWPLPLLDTLRMDMQTTGLDQAEPSKKTQRDREVLLSMIRERYADTNYNAKREVNPLQLAQLKLLDIYGATEESEKQLRAVLPTAVIRR